MKKLDFNIDLAQWFWICVLSISTSISVLLVDEAVFNAIAWKLSGRDSYWFWVSTSLFFAAIACAFVSWNDKCIGSGIP